MSSSKYSNDRLDEFVVEQEDIGSGVHSTVMLARHQNKMFAIKRYNTDTATLDTLAEETAVLRRLMNGGGHPGIIEFFGERPKAIFTTRNGKQESTVALVLEYAEGGELFSYLQKGSCDPTICRAYFLELLSAVRYMHEQGVCHRDLKPQNIMLDSQGRLKIIDFGSSGFADKGLLNNRVGTEPYMAPEIRQGSYDGLQADVFSLGVILFTMYFGYPPFINAKSNDPLYTHLCKPDENDRAAFWSYHKKRRPVLAVSEDFKDLIGRMLALRPTDRLSLTSIRNHTWCQGATANSETLYTEFMRRTKDC